MAKLISFFAKRYRLMTNNKPADPVKNAQAKEDTSLTGNGKNPYRRSALTKLFLISAVGVGLSLISSAKLAATNLADKKLSLIHI